MNKHNKQKGFNLIELMVTITIGSFLILGAAYAFQEAQKTYVTNDNVARLYEQAQYVLDVLEEDIRLNTFWGLHNKRSAVEGDSNNALIPAAVTNITGDCDDEWALDLRTNVSGSNGINSAAVVLPTWANNTPSCITSLAEAVEKKVISNADTLVLRHADYQVQPVPVAGQVYVRSDEALPLSKIFVGTAEPIVSLNAQNYHMISHGYYLTSDSYTAGDNTPMLRRMSLINNGGAPAVVSQEITSGVEDLQIQFGIDLDQKSMPGYGSIDLYVDPDNALLAVPTTRVMAVRMWVLLRGDKKERGFTSDATYNYADVTFNHPNDEFRRLLVSKTVQIRNMETQ